MKAKAAGVKFTFGSNNVTQNVSDLSYSIRMMKECGLTAEDMYKPKVKNLITHFPHPNPPFRDTLNERLGVDLNEGLFSLSQHPSHLHIPILLNNHLAATYDLITVNDTRQDEIYARLNP